MAARQSEFPKADVKLVLSKLRGINKAAIQSALDSSTVSVKQFVDACKPLASGSVTAHELITVARHYASGGKVDYRKFLAEL